MAPQNGGGGGGCGDDIDHQSAKHVLDSIGQQVHDQVKKEAKNYIGELAGQLSFATLSGGESAGFSEPCGLIKDKRDKLLGARGERNPCGIGKEDDSKRFSKESGGECDNNKIEGNVRSKGKGGNNEGACAPYRRLSLCNKNFQKINNYSSNAKHNLLLDVCMAANYEAQSLINYRAQYDAEYSSGSGSPMCTMLARSFADIGDIVRGKDLYLGNKKKSENKREKEKLEENFKKYFQQIHEDVTNGKKGEIETRYKGDPEFFKLREDWWTANRETVWKAMTCSDDLDNSSYFRPTCSDRKGSCSQANKYCRCNGDKPDDDKANTDPPTYFDYVPQYLRWFEEWAEDFCRKKKKKVEKLEQQCRGQDKEGNQRYCSRNGFDCEKTISRIGKVRMGKGCTDCFFACNPYVDWIEKQKEQFDKQVKKYTDEIKIYTEGAPVSRRQKRNARGGSDHKGYEKKFYAKLKEGGYNDVGKFLELLSKENVCTQITDEKEGKINFKQVNTGSTGGSVRDASGGASGTNDKEKGTFYRSKYCQPCPDCGVRHKGKGEFEDKETTGIKCAGQNLYNPKNDANPTPIKILKSGEGEKDIETKLEAFCKKEDDESLYAAWKCYKEDDIEKQGDDEEDYENVKNSGGLCILKNERSETNSQKEPDEIQKTFYDFFTYWVAHMLKDSIHWKKKLGRCLEKKNGNRCRKGCIKNCKCFLQWVEQKKDEWGQTKVHFNTQKGFELFNYDYDFVLKEILKKDELLSSIKEGYGDANEIKHIKQLLEDEENVVDDSKKKNTIDKLIDHELTDANTCTSIHNEENCEDPKPKPPDGDGGARSETFTPPAPSPPEDGNHSDESDDDLHDEDEDADEEEESEETADDNTGSQEGTAKEEAPKQDTEDTKQKVDGSSTTTPTVDVCAIVNTLFTNGDPQNTFKEACKQKYDGKYYGWKCISDTTTSGGDSAPSGVTTTKSSDSGSICIPPRRRKLYIDKIKEWAGITVNGDSSESSVSGSGTEAQASDVSQGNGVSTSTTESSLLHAFIESAAVETFFLWHRYKKIKLKEKQEELQRQRESGFGLIPPEVPEGAANDEKNPEEQLKKGEIPEEFKRQMFYTLGDYRDILVRGGDVNSGSKKEGGGSNSDRNIVLNAGGDQKSRDEMEVIQKKIQEHINSGSKPPGQKSENPRESWWEKNAPHIWKGMIYALTYKDNTDSGPKGTDSKPPEHLEDVEKAFFGTQNGKPVPQPVPPGTFESTYKYDKVQLKEDNTSSAKPTTQNPTSGDDPLNNPKLSDFVKLPPFFRWLHEWGNSFCFERAKRLAQIKVDCKVEEGDRGKKQKQKCSGYGEHCDDNLSEDPSTFPSFKCHSCGIECRKYKKWIERKGKEFEEQKQEYSKQKTDAEGNNNGNEFYKKLTTTYKESKNFLENLGPCKKDKENVKDKLDFSQPQKTFKHTKQCDPCSEFKVKCNGSGDCNKDERRNCTEINKRHITAEDIGNGGDSTEDIGMLVSDNSGNGFNGLDECKGAGIFKGIKKDVWTCGKVCGYNVCKPKNVNGEKGNGNEIIIIRACGLNGADNSKKSKDGKERDLVLCLIEKLGEKAEKCEENHAQNGVQSCTQTTPQTPHLPDDEEENIEENPVEHPKICGNMPTQPEQQEEETCDAPSAEEKKDEKKEESAADSEQKPEEKPEEEAPAPEGTENQPPSQPKPPKPTPPYLSPPLKTALMSSTIMWSIGI
ncbi:hypothetical protein PFTANZ_05790, partial [Plasmodium falciparum Tanzania (2000708)]